MIEAISNWHLTPLHKATTFQRFSIDFYMFLTELNSDFVYARRKIKCGLHKQRKEDLPDHIGINR